jgi:methylenetetrahydrofolate reductase (NADPH)
MGIGDLYEKKDFTVSFEIFPPKTGKGEDSLDETLQRLVPYRPGFISCTYGAGGSTSQNTLDWCLRIQKLGATATAHFTCVGSPKTELLRWLRWAEDHRVENIMALRGDPPKGSKGFPTVEGGLKYGNELVTLIRENFPTMGIGVAGYPEKHPEAVSASEDLSNLKRKVDAGADAIYTQLFYVNDHFFRFRDACAEIGIQKPLIPGIMPITNFARIQRISALCGADLPGSLVSDLEKAKDDSNAQFEIGVAHAIRQCESLRENDCPGIHFYVLNQARACEKILHALHLAPPQQDCA